MGMGEPAHNLDNVLDAIELLGTAGAIGHKNLVFSTVGDRARVRASAAGSRQAGAGVVAAFDVRATRAPNCCRAPRASTRPSWSSLAEDYARATGYPIQYQWTLLEGINDGDDEVERIVALLAGKYAVMNLIPYNTVDGFAFRRPPRERAERMARSLCERGILTKLRQSAGQDVDGGCGQLRARVIAPPTRQAMSSP